MPVTIINNVCFVCLVRRVLRPCFTEGRLCSGAGYPSALLAKIAVAEAPKPLTSLLHESIV